MRKMINKNKEKTQSQENNHANKHNNELHVVEVTLEHDGNVAAKIVMGNVLEEVPEFVDRGIEEHGFPSNKQEVTLQKDSPKKGIKALREQINEEKTGPEI